MIIGFNGTEMDSELRNALDTLRPAGVILFARNLETAPQIWSLTHECRRTAKIPMFVCVDMEGGTVDRLKNVIAPAPSVARIVEYAVAYAAASGDRQLYRRHGEVIGRECRALGFNTDFAPVFDLGLDASRAVLGSRTVSADAKQTVIYAREFLRGLRSAGVLGCGKHFPGLGEANLDSHHHMPVVNKPWKALWEQDLLPYRKLHRSLPFVMVAHAAYPAVTRNSLPASLSKKWLTDILRRKIGYQGLILADDLEMGGILAAGSIEDVAVETLRAGADMFLVCNNPKMVWQAYESVIKAAESDPKFARQVAAAAQRVEKYKLRITPPSAAPSAIKVKALRESMANLAEDIQKDGPSRHSARKSSLAQ